MVASMQQQQQRDQELGEPRRTCIQDNEPVRNLLTDDVASSSVTRQFWSRRGEWSQGSTMVADTPEPRRQACPVCGKAASAALAHTASDPWCTCSLPGRLFPRVPHP